MFNSVLNEMRDLFQNLNTSQSMLLKAIVIWCVYLLVRNIPSIITAVALVKEAKRHNYNKVVCGLFGYAFPIIAPIGFFLVVKYSERQINYSEKKGISGRTVITFFTSAIIIVISFVLAFTATAVGIGSFIRSSLTDEHLKTYYDKMGNEYHELDTTIDMYDRDWNKYVYKFDGLFDPVVYIDENGNEYDSDRCFIDSEGWFVYDYDGSFKYDESYEQYICYRFTDGDGNKYYQLGNLTFEMDEDGEIYAYMGKAIQKLDFTN